MSSTGHTAAVAVLLHIPTQLAQQVAIQVTHPTRPDLLVAECGSTRHKQRDCPQRRPPTETPARVAARSGSSSTVKAARVTNGEESLDDQCHRLADQPAEAEYTKDE